MEPLFKILPNEGVTAPAGFRAGGVFCDIKRLGTGKGSSKGQKRDLAVLYSAVDASVAGMFTTNQVCAAPVKVSESRVPGGVARAVVANSGNANACTGEQGIRDARRMTELTAELLGIEAEKVLVCSTGRIGVQMPMENVERGIRMALETASDTAESAHFAAEAIMTSDNVSKETAVELVLGGKTVRVAGMCKGAGMIQPGMSATGKRPAATPRQLHATMLGFITTDAAIRARISPRDPLAIRLSNQYCSLFFRPNFFFFPRSFFMAPPPARIPSDADPFGPLYGCQYAPTHSFAIST